MSQESCSHPIVTNEKPATRWEMGQGQTANEEWKQDSDPGQSLTCIIFPPHQAWLLLLLQWILVTLNKLWYSDYKIPSNFSYMITGKKSCWTNNNALFHLHTGWLFPELFLGYHSMGPPKQPRDAGGQILLFLFDRCGNGGTGRWKDWPKIA